MANEKPNFRLEEIPILNVNEDLLIMRSGLVWKMIKNGGDRNERTFSFLFGETCWCNSDSSCACEPYESCKDDCGCDTDRSKDCSDYSCGAVGACECQKDYMPHSCTCDSN